MKKMRLLSLAVVPMCLAQCAPAGLHPGAAPLAPRCDPNYSGCVPIDSDVDCSSGNGNGPSYVAGPVESSAATSTTSIETSDGIGCGS